MTEEQARKRANAEKGFYGNLAAYLVTMSMLTAINLLSWDGAFWAIWPMFGWGIGIVSHGLGVFGLPGKGRGWEERRVRELMGAEGSVERLRGLVDEAVERRAPRARSPRSDADEAARLRERVEHLEAIVTSHDWDLVEPRAPATPRAAAPPPERRLEAPPDPDDPETPEEHVARLARRVR